MENNGDPDFDVLREIFDFSDVLKEYHCDLGYLRPTLTEEALDMEEKVNAYFGTSCQETWMLCAMISYYFEKDEDVCSLKQLANYLESSVRTIIVYKTYIENLLKKRYIYNTESFIEDEIDLKNNFKVAPEVLRAVLHNKKIVLAKKENNQNKLLYIIRKIGKIINGDGRLTCKKEKISILEERYSDEKFLNDIKLIIPDDIETRMFFYDACYLFLIGCETELLRTLNDTYGEFGKFWVVEHFMNENQPLFKYDLIEFTEKEILSTAKVEISLKAKEMLLGENAKLFIKQSEKRSDIIMPENIRQKKLFYNSENEREIELLTSALQDENLNSIQDRLRKKGLPIGFTILFYGAPGTGKTETAYQIARTTGRKVLHIDISNIKACWYGDSEKRIKRIFADYKDLCNSCKNEQNGKAPILLFNEADGILSKRKDVVLGNTAQTENTMQNIILEEMEKLEGIMIATTNLADNLDTAFERRFLFKIKFEKPSLDAKQKIWKSKLDWLSEDEISFFARNYDFSGGQIENIITKSSISYFLSGKYPDYAELQKLCNNEKLYETEKKIGFGA